MKQKDKKYSQIENWESEIADRREVKKKGMWKGEFTGTNYHTSMTSQSMSVDKLLRVLRKHKAHLVLKFDEDIEGYEVDYGVRDKVIIIRNISKHKFKLGNEVTISKIYHSQDGYECINSKGETWFVEREEIKLKQ